MSGTVEIAPARPEKSAAAFRTISEVAEDLDLPPHVLRFWESKFPQLQPLKRGGGRRYYRPEDIRLLRHIRQCLYQDGYTIRGVQKLLGPPGDERPPESGRAIPPTTMPTLFPLDASDADPPSADRPGAADQPSVPERPARRPRRRPSAGDPERRAALEEIRRELLEARAALAELLGPPSAR